MMIISNFYWRELKARSWHRWLLPHPIPRLPTTLVTGLLLPLLPAPLAPHMAILSSSQCDVSGRGVWDFREGSMEGEAPLSASLPL